MSEKLNILVTGATGFVGQNLVCKAVERGHNVIALVRDPSKTPSGARALVHELGSGTSFDFPDDVSAVVHLAQSRSYRAFPDDCDEMFRVNVAGTHEVLLKSAQAKISRFCLVSSGTVYEPFAGVLNENTHVSPFSNLGATKFAAELISKPYNALFPVSILRLFAPYGFGQQDRLIPELIRRVRADEAVTLPETGGGMCFAPTYVDDINDVIFTALSERWGGIFNVATPEKLTIEDVVVIIAKILGKKPVFERKAGAAPVVVPDLAKLGERYDLSRFRPFTDGIATTLSGGH